MKARQNETLKKKAKQTSKRMKKSWGPQKKTEGTSLRM